LFAIHCATAWLYISISIEQAAFSAEIKSHAFLIIFLMLDFILVMSKNTTSTFNDDDASTVKKCTDCLGMAAPACVGPIQFHGKLASYSLHTYMYGYASK
jgi:hypothetical protein